MKLAVLGANGATGKDVVELALSQGHSVTAVVRREDAVIPAGATKVVANALDGASMAEVVPGHDAILVCLGTRRLGKTELMQQATDALIKACHATDVRRVVVVSALGVGQTSGLVRGLYGFLTRTVMGTIFADKNLADATLEKSDLEWTIVAPGMLSNSAPSACVAESADNLGRIPAMPKTPRKNVAQTMLDAVTAQKWIGKIVAVYAK